MKRHTCFTVLGEPFFAIGCQAHNSSGHQYQNQAELDLSFQRTKEIGANMISMPIGWGLFEPTEGEFNAEYVTTLIDTARKWDLKLIFLWFGAWKNGTSTYAPQWVLRDPEKYPRVRTFDGGDSTILTPHAPENLAADQRAFCEFVKILRDYDQSVGTVISVQIENESGFNVGTRRDFSEFGNQDFAKQVPIELIETAKQSPNSWLGKNWVKNGQLTAGHWTEVFGIYGAEACSAWGVASFINQMAKAGKEIYDLFMYTNAWLDNNQEKGWDLAGFEYPAGGPVSKNLEVWYTAAPYLDAISPDIYGMDILSMMKTQEIYARPTEGWPLYVPESNTGSPNATLMFNGIGNLDAIGYEVFGIESNYDPAGVMYPDAEATLRSFTMLAAAQPLLEKKVPSQEKFGLVQTVGKESQLIQLDDYKLWVSYTGAGFMYNGWTAIDYHHQAEVVRGNPLITDVMEETGRGLLFRESEKVFYLVGHYLRIYIDYQEPLDGSIPARRLYQQHQSHNNPILAVEEGYFKDGEFQVTRTRTGDEFQHGVWALYDVGVIRITMI